jgi:hypothetical protein
MELQGADSRACSSHGKSLCSAKVLPSAANSVEISKAYAALKFAGASPSQPISAGHARVAKARATFPGLARCSRVSRAQISQVSTAFGAFSRASRWLPIFNIRFEMTETQFDLTRDRFALLCQKTLGSAEDSGRIGACWNQLLVCGPARNVSTISRETALRARPTACRNLGSDLSPFRASSSSRS